MKRLIFLVFICCTTAFGQVLPFPSYPIKPWRKLHKANPSLAVLDQLIRNAIRNQWDTIPLNLLVVKYGKYLINTPYIKGPPIGVNTSLKPIFCLKQLDCYTLVDNALALALATKTVSQPSSDPPVTEYCPDSLGVLNYSDTLQKTVISIPLPPQLSRKELFLKSYFEYLENIRYRKGIHKGFTSRLHYTRDLISDNELRGRWINITSLFKTSYYYPTFRVLSKTLPKNSKRYKDMVKIEDSLSKMPFIYIPKENYIKILPDLMEGDIIGFVPSNNKLLDVTHVGFITKQGNVTRLLHASQKVGKVTISKQSLGEYLDKKTIRGFIIVRLPS